MAQGQPRFDRDTVRSLAGERSFARGEAYHREGRIDILSLSADRVLAEAAGSEDYRVELSGRGQTIGGSCTCRAFEDYGFCKHMVATALTANATGAESKGALDTVGRIRAYLNQQQPGALVDMIIALAESDLTLLRRLDSAAAITLTDDKTLEVRLRKAIDKATRLDDYLDYGEVTEWAAGVKAVLDPIATLASGSGGEVAFRLIEHALRRVSKAIESIDDSDGEGGGLLARAQDIHLAAVKACRPDPVTLARDLFTHETEGISDVFDGAAEAYAEVLGDRGLAEYRRLAASAWSKIPAQMGKRSSAGGSAIDEPRVAAILDYFAELDGDLDARIALRAKNLSSPLRYLSLAQFCSDNGREQQALRYAEEGLWIFEDDKADTALLTFAVKLLDKAGREEDASRQLWRAFEQQPTFGLYKTVRKRVGAAMRGRAIAVAEAHAGRPRNGFWGHPAEVLIEIFLHEKMFDEAWSAKQRYGASDDLTEALVAATEATRPHEAIAFYAAKIERLANSGQGASYQQAARLIERLSRLRAPSEHASYLADIKERFRRRRNFMKLLD
jgi:hypothetical protein